MQVLTPRAQPRFLLLPPQFRQPLERGLRLKLIGVIVQMNRGGLSLGQREGYLLRGPFQPLQVHPGGSRVNAADYPATLFQTGPALSFPARLYHGIEPHSGEGNEKIRQKPLRVLQPERFRLGTVANRDFDPFVLQALRIPITASNITVDLERMNVSAQTTRFAARTELQNLYE
jgi:hypothetical protein